MARKSSEGALLFGIIAGVFGVGFVLRRRRRRARIQEAAAPTPFSPGGALTVWATGSDVGFAVWLTRAFETEVTVADLSDLFDVTIMADTANPDDVNRFADKLQLEGVSVSVVNG